MSAKQPHEIHALFLDAFNRGDVEALICLYEPHAILVTGDGSAVGHDAIRAAFRRFVSGGGRMQMVTRAIVDSGDGLAVLHGSWSLESGQDTISGLSTEVVRRQPDGSWLYVVDEPRTPEDTAA
ncbi:MAG TPA: nuclear transport factor 2 family protein [Candidatus Eisenbacteria bacterium]|nr:nuclear transport factor 2 family protein [Candidatus Eisenbacteria bacterium]